MDKRKSEIVPWLLLQLFYFVIAQSSICPAPEAILPCICTSRHEDLQIWCTHSDLPQVLKGLQKIGDFIRRPIDELIIENNYLPSLPGKVFQNVRITRLMLRHNGLERLSAAWLETQDMNLVEIFIVENELKSLPAESLSKLQNIQAITIQSQNLKRIPTLSGLRKLRYINIQSESLNAINENTFENLPNVEKIFIEGSPNLRILKENAFYNLPQLRKLAITYCGINAIHMRALSLLPSLKELSLSNNQINDASMIGRAIRDLPTLSRLNLNHNQLDKLNEGAFVDQTMLEHLFLSNNNISIIHHGAFHRVPKLRTVDLNYNRINQIHPESFLQHSSSGVEELTLIGNQIMYISEFRALLDALPRLKFLDLSDNLLQEIPRGALRGHPSLERLHLTKNSIKYIQADAFVAMPALRELHLSNNSLSDLNEGPYWNLPALKGLDLSFNYFTRLQPKLLYNLPSLRRINFSNNQLAVIDPITFLESPLLEHVNVSGNLLVSIHPATFRNLAKLYELDASSNRLIEFVPGLPRGLEQLYLNQNQITNLPMPPSPDLDLPSLRTLDLSSNGIQKIPYGSLHTLHNLRRFYMKRNGLRQVEIATFNDLERLEILDISYNQILTVHPKSFNKLTSLKEINLHGNTIENFDFIAIQDNAALSSLDFSKNKLKSINPTSVNKALEVEILNISTNNLYELPRTLNKMSKLKVLDASFNNIKHFDGNSINSIKTLKDFMMPSNKLAELKTGCFKDLRDLETIDLDNNDIEIVHPKAITNLPNLISIYLTRNHIIDLPDRAFSNLPKLKVLEMQGNRLQYVSYRAFDNMMLVQYLNLSNNHIANIDDSGLRQLSSLEVLDLSFNKLKRLTRASFQYMEWLVELNLDNNLICHISGQPFDFMPRLKVLSLRNNRISTLSEKTYAKLRNNIAILDFDGNPLICNCHMIWLKSWLTESTSVGPKCADGTYVKGMPFGRYDCPSTGEINEDDIRSCMTHDNEALLPNLATSQVFSTLNKIKDYTSQIKNNYQANKFNRPSPEESDYFYDEYIDYPYNETLINSLNNEVSSTQNHNSTSGGRVPTIYAAMNNSTHKFTPTLPANSPNGGFTFFGMPLPPIDMGKLLNTGRKMDWPEKKTTQSSNTHNINNHNKYQLPEVPKFETGGFSPIIPNTVGGFKPMLDPRVNISNKQVQTQGDKNYSNEASIKHTIAVVSTKPPMKTVQSNTSHQKSKSEIHELEAYVDDDNGTHLAYNRTKNIEEQKVEPNNMSKYNLMESNLTVTQVTEKETIVITTDTSNDMSVQAWMESSTSSYSSSTAITVRPHMKKHIDQPPPTASLAVLAASKTAEALERNQNRPATITKVNLAHIDNYDHNFSPNREPKTRFSDMSTSNTKTREVDDNDWYYKNYNNSNLKPYIAPGIHKETSNANTINYNILLVFVITYCIII